MRCLRIALAVAILAPAGDVAAQEPGVTYDPDSPAGREYEIPLESARRNAGGGGSDPAPRGTGGANGSGQGSPLFGAGIKPRAQASQEETDGSGAAGGSSGSGSGSGSGGSSAQEDARTTSPSTAAPSAAVTAARNAGGEQMRTGLLLAAVAGIGVGAAALVLRRRRPHGAH